MNSIVRMKESYVRWYNHFRYNIAPALFIIVFTSLVQIFALLGRNEEITLKNIWRGQFGNFFSWSFVLLFITWAIMWMKMPFKTIQGPKCPYGNFPLYKEGNMAYYYSTLGIYLLIEYFSPNLSSKIFWNIPYILGSFNIISFLLCFYLYLTGNNHQDDVNLPRFYKFYRGCDFHPTIFGVDVKQLTICRIGVFLWQLLPLVYFINSCKTSSFDFGFFVSLLIQSVYIWKCVVYECYYALTTLDFCLDRAGYYLCWGCMVWMPTFFAFTQYYLTLHPTTISLTAAILCLIIGLTAILIHYKFDNEKELIRSTNGNCSFNGREPRFITAEYIDETNGKTMTSLLVTSGLWGKARHLNYTCEMVISTTIVYPGISVNFIVCLYPLFFFCVLIHRIWRDELKCQKKYGEYWKEYCKKVPYRFIPYVF